MRLAVAVGALLQSLDSFTGPHGWTIGVPEALIGGLLLIGFLTPVASASAALANLALSVSWFAFSGESAHERGAIAALLAVVSVSLIFLGPGAYSLDARLFGRREIIIP